MDFGWSLTQIQPSPGFYEQRKVFRKVIGPKAVQDYDQVIQKEAESLIRSLASFTGNPLQCFYRNVSRFQTLKSFTQPPPVRLGS